MKINTNSNRAEITEEEKGRRRRLALPVRKTLRYMRRTVNGYKAIEVVDFKVWHTYFPSGTPSLEIQLLTGERIKILLPFFRHMQKPSFEKDLEKMAKELDIKIY